MDVAWLIRNAMGSLVNGWDEEVAAFNADPANLVELEPLPDVADSPSGKAVYFGGKPDHLVYPAVEVQCAEMEVWNLSLGQRSGDAAAPITVAVWLEGGDGEVPALYEQSVGYAAKVIVPILIQADAFGAGIVLSREGRAVQATWAALPVGDPDPDTRRFHRWRTSAIIVFQIGDIQTG